MASGLGVLVVIYNERATLEELRWGRRN